MTAVSDRPSVAPAPTTPARLRPPTWLLVVAGLAVLAGVVLRFVARSPLWLDEALTVNIARVPLGDLQAALKVDGAPPLYYVLLHAWMAVFGTGTWAVRALSGIISLGALVAVWFAARRLARADATDSTQGSTVAWIAVAVLATNPYAIRYATEARMYALAILIVTLGYLAVARAMERPSIGRLAAVALAVAGLLYTQYWGIYLLAAVGLWLLWGARPKCDTGAAARRVIGAFVAGGVLFLPWLPTFLYQSARTGTPWGQAIPPPTGLSYALLDFSGTDHWEGYSLFMASLLLVALGVFGVARSNRTIELDVRGRAATRPVALVTFGALVIGLSASLASATAFQGRYAAVVFPLWVLLVAVGLARFIDARILAGALIVVVGLGCVGGARNAIENRTQAQQVADAINARAKPGDVVAYCPDQVAPDTSRLVRGNLTGVAFPSGDGPERINWVDYAKRVEAADPTAFANSIAERAGATGAIFFVYSPGYRHFGVKCEAAIDALRSRRADQMLVLPDEKLFEKQGLVFFPAP